MEPFPKLCSCGRVHDAESWSRLPQLGVTDYSTPDDPCVLAMANCECHTTLAIDVTPGAQVAP